MPRAKKSAPKTKKNVRKTYKKKNYSSETDSGTDNVNSETEDSESKMWVLNDDKQVRISEFKGCKFVDIRKYYEDKQGKTRRTAKGIFLKVDEWKNLLKAADKVNRAIDLL